MIKMTSSFQVKQGSFEDNIQTNDRLTTTRSNQIDQNQDLLCITCKINICNDVTCIITHFHEGVLRLDCSQANWANARFNIVSGCIKYSLNRLKTVVGQSNLSSKTACKLYKKIAELQKSFNDAALDQQVLKDIEVTTTVEEFLYYDQRRAKRYPLSIVSKLIAAHRTSLFQNIQELRKELFIKVIVSKFIGSKGPKSSLQRIRTEKRMLERNIELKLEQLKSICQYSYQGFFKKSQNLIVQQYSDFQFEPLDSFCHSIVLNKSCFQQSARVIKEITDRQRNLRKRFKFGKSLRGGSDLIRAEFAFDTQNLADWEVAQYLQYRSARVQIQLILQSHKQIREEFAEVYNQFLQNEDYEKAQRFFRLENQLLEKLQKRSGESCIDLVYCMDCTASMRPFFKQAKLFITKLAAQYLQRFGRDSVQVGFVGYRDHDQIQPIQFCPLTSPQKALKFVERISLFGGNDQSEAVIDGLYETSRMEYRVGSIRAVVLIADSPPHGSNFRDPVKGPRGPYFYDNYPAGCPCGKSFQTLKSKFEALGVNFSFMPVRKMQRVQNQFERLLEGCCNKGKLVAKPVDVKQEVLHILIRRRQELKQVKDRLLLRMQNSVGLIVKAIVLQIQEFFDYLQQYKRVSKIHKFSDELQDYINGLRVRQSRLESESVSVDLVVQGLQSKFRELRQQRQDRILEKGVHLLAHSEN